MSWELLIKDVKTMLMSYLKCDEASADEMIEAVKLEEMMNESELTGHFPTDDWMEAVLCNYKPYAPLKRCPKCNCILTEDNSEWLSNFCNKCAREYVIFVTEIECNDTELNKYIEEAPITHQKIHTRKEELYNLFLSGDYKIKGDTKSE